MSFDFLSFLEEYGIDYNTHGKNINSSDDWIGINCPFCNDSSNHLGINVTTGMATCWRCGWHSQMEIIKKLTGFDWKKVKRIIEQFGGTERKRYKRINREKDIEVVYPPGTLTSFSNRHTNYLIRRGFDSKRIKEIWSIKATGRYGAYKNRIIAPITFNKIIVSYQGRDITDRHPERYKACNSKEERIPHKSCLYGLDYAIGKTVLVVEGFTDVWRMGIGSVGTLGSTITQAQILLLNQRFTQIFFLFDPEEEAQRKANQAVMDLAVMGTQAENISLDIKRDPGDMTNKEASFIMRDLLIK